MFRRYVSRRVNWYLDIAVAVFAIIGALGFIVPWFDRGDPVSVYSRIYLNYIVRPGGRFEYMNYFRRHEYCTAMVSRWIQQRHGQSVTVYDISDLGSPMPTTGLNILQESKASIPIPLNVPDGRAAACYQSTWKCNWTHEIWPVKSKKTCLPFIVQRWRPAASPQTDAPDPPIP